MTMDLGIKATVTNWLEDKWKNWIKNPIATKTEQMENQVSQKVGEYSNKAQAQVRKPFDYYRKQQAFYRGLFWISMVLLIVLWIIAGS